MHYFSKVDGQKTRKEQWDGTPAEQVAVLTAILLQTFHNLRA